MNTEEPTTQKNKGVKIWKTRLVALGVFGFGVVLILTTFVLALALFNQLSNELASMAPTNEGRPDQATPPLEWMMTRGVQVMLLFAMAYAGSMAGGLGVQLYSAGRHTNDND